MMKKMGAIMIWISKLEIYKNWDTALFLLRVTCEHSLTHEGVNKISQSIQDYTEAICANAAKRY